MKSVLAELILMHQLRGVMLQVVPLIRYPLKMATIIIAAIPMSILNNRTRC